MSWADAVDRALGRVPTHRLVAGALTALAAVSLVLALAGRLQQSPVELLASLAVAVGGSVAAGRLVALTGRAPAHDVSAVITGLLLFFLFFPSAAPLDLGLLALAALVAAASKRLVVVGGRHVLNPAAVGAFAVGLTGLVGSAWWVATPVLLPFTTIAAVAVAIRTRVLLPAAVLVVVGALLEAVAQLGPGASVPALLGGALTSTPLVFLAGFMFSEPVTLPPRRWQRLVEAVLVGALVALVFADVPRVLGVPTLESAVLAGNLLSLALARPAAARMRLAGRRPLTATAVELAFTPDRPLRHRPGQYLELQVPHRGADRRGIRRSLTIVSPPSPADGAVRVAVRSAPARSSFKRALTELPVGGAVRATLVSGAFTWPADRTRPLLLAASGIGITPFVSQLQDEARRVAGGASPRDVVLVLRVPEADDVPYAELLAGSGARLLLVRPQAAGASPAPAGWTALPRLDAAALQAAVPGLERRVAYVSGSPGFVARTRRLLRSSGVRRVRVDAFTGY